MPTSGTFRPTEPAGPPPGFTLLEVIVVLAIMGLVTAVVTPSVLRGIDSWRRQAQADLVIDQLRGLPGRARATGRTIEVSADTLSADDAPLRVEEGWRLAVPSPWRVQANGACGGGQVELHGGDRVVVVDVAAPFCDARVREGD